MQILKDIYEVFFPKRCLACQRILVAQELHFCLHCFAQFPYTNYPLDNKNAVNRVFAGKSFIVAVTSLFFFDKAGIVQNMLHHLKYKRKSHLGIYIARLLWNRLEESTVLSEVTAIVPVPIHYLKKQKRGYHQLYHFGKSLSEKCKVPYYPNLLKVNTFRFSQTNKNLSQRFENVSGKYVLNPKFDLSRLPENNCILLIDDVLTTGATLLACIKPLEKIASKIMIVTMAYVHNEYL